MDSPDPYEGMRTQNDPMWGPLKIRDQAKTVEHLRVALNALGAAADNANWVTEDDTTISSAYACLIGGWYESITALIEIMEDEITS